jgi:redox-sensitive bicupin YhaK (pirin superfamily)
MISRMRITRRNALVGAAVGLPVGIVALVRRETGGVVTASPDPAVANAATSLASSGASSGARPIADVIASTPTIEGAGVHLRRALGARALPMLDPFLLLDEFHSDDPNDYAAGFPSHPHRGFETVTYMIEGAMEHKDSVGNHGRLGPKSAQWMTAGHGIVHSEMPKQERGLMWGFQLWVNLPKRSKLMKPRYQDIAPAAIPEIERERARVRVIAGRAFDATGPVNGIEVDPIFLDLALERGARISHALPRGHNAFAYVTDGAVRLGPEDREVRRGQLAVLGEGDSFVARCDADSGRVILVAGRPVNEPVARGGPFVMNTREEIEQAWEDYRSGRLTDGA